MNTPLSTFAALKHVDTLLKAGVSPSRLVLLCSTPAAVRTWQHLVDLITPLGQYDSTVFTDWRYARHLLVNTNNLHLEVPRDTLTPVASAAVLRRVLASITGNRYKPPNDPYKYFRQLQDILWSLSYNAISIEETERKLSLEPSAKLQDITAIYAAWRKYKDAINAFDSADYMYYALTYPSTLQQYAASSADSIVLPDAHGMAPACSRLLSLVLPSQEMQHSNQQPKPIQQQSHLDFFFDQLEMLHNTGVYNGIVEQAELGSRWRVHLEASFDPADSGTFANLSQKLGIPAKIGETRRVDSQRIVPTGLFAQSFGEVQLLTTPAGVDNAPRRARITSLNAKSGETMLSSMRTLLKSIASSTTAAPKDPLRPLAYALSKPGTVCIACRGPAQARELFTELQEHLPPDSQLHFDYSIFLRDMEDVRVMMAAISLLARSDDDQALFQVLTSSAFKISHAEMQRLLEHHRLEGGKEPLLQFAMSLIGKNSLQVPKQRLLPGMWDASPLVSHDVPTVEPPTAPPLRTLLFSPSLAHGLRVLQEMRAEYDRSLSVTSAIRVMVRRSHLKELTVSPTSPMHDIRGRALAAFFRMTAEAESGQLDASSFRTKHESSDAAATFEKHNTAIRGASFIYGVLHDFLVDQGVLLRLDASSPAIHIAEDSAELERLELNAPFASDMSVLDVVDGPDIAGFLHKLGHSPALVVVPDPRLHIVITTESRARYHAYDWTIFPWLQDSAMPGALASHEFSFVFERIPLLHSTRSASRAEHIQRRATQFLSCMARSHQGVIAVSPPPPSLSLASTSRRSRFLDALLGPSHVVKAKTPEAARAQAVNKLIKEAEPMSLSYTRMHEYLWCPHRYYLRRIMGLTGSSTAGMLYGRSLHAAVAVGTAMVRSAVLLSWGIDPEEFMLLKPSEKVAKLMQMEWGTQEKLVLSFPALLESINAEFDMVWRGRAATIGSTRGGIDEEEVLGSDLLDVTPAQAAELHAAGKAALSLFVQQEIILHESNSSRRAVLVPVLIEEDFQVMVAEMPPTSLKGVMDRVDFHWHAGGSPRLNIVEYKSSLQWKQEAALERRRRDKLQTTMYQFALSKVIGTECGHIPVTAEIRAIETGDVFPMTSKTSDVQKAIDKMRDVADRIKQSQFEAVPSAVKCGMCSMANSCSHAYGALRAATGPASSST